MAFKNKIQPGYKQAKDSLKDNFEEAYNFLNFIEKLNKKGFHVGTSKNLHLYFKDSFLFYFKILSLRAVVISSKPNRDIKRHTYNHSDFFFNQLIKELKQNQSVFEKNIENNNNGYKIIINDSPNSKYFFEFVKNTLIVIEKSESLIELSNELVQLTEEFQILNSEDGISLTEGIQKTAKRTYYERNSKARQQCLDYWGFKCVVCEFDFKKVYGKIGDQYIHVHHLTPISEIREEYKIDPIKDLRPVCPNCHAMIHRKKEAFTIEELKKIVEQNKPK